MGRLAPAAEALATRVTSARFGFSFGRAVFAFLRFLAAVPDSNPLQVTAAELADLRTTSARVIESIARRLDPRHARQSIRQRLASAVYEITYETDAIERWYRHFTTGDGDARQRHAAARQGALRGAPLPRLAERHSRDEETPLPDLGVPH